MNVFAQISKVDEAKRLVFGRAAAEEVDKSGEIMDYASTKPHFQKWSDDVSADSGGKSLGNLRAMHGKVAAGKLTQIAFDDAALAIEVCAKVVDDAEWKKVLEGVYTGFSIGGSYVGKPTIEKVDGRDIKRYTAAPNELSLVDRPCISSATFFEVQKADGSTAQVDFQPAQDEEDDGIDVVGSPDEILALGKLMNDHKLTVAETVARLQKALTDDANASAAAAAAKPVDPIYADPVAKAYPITDAASVRRSHLALTKLDADKQTGELLDTLAKAWQEKVGTPLPATTEALAELEKALASEQRQELYGSPDVVGALVKVMAGEAPEGDALAKLESDALANLVKALPAHAAAVRLALAPVAEAPAVVDVQKLLDAALAPMQKRLEDQAAELLKLSQQPAPARVSLRAVSKRADTIVEHHSPEPVVQKITDSKGAPNETATLIKSIHQSGGRPLMQLAK